jgi:hypothetical protein
MQYMVVNKFKINGICILEGWNTREISGKWRRHTVM